MQIITCSTDGAEDKMEMILSISVSVCCLLIFSVWQWWNMSHTESSAACLTQHNTTLTPHNDPLSWSVSPSDVRNMAAGICSHSATRASVKLRPAVVSVQSVHAKVMDGQVPPQHTRKHNSLSTSLHAQWCREGRAHTTAWNVTVWCGIKFPSKALKTHLLTHLYKSDGCYINTPYFLTRLDTFSLFPMRDFLYFSFCLWAPVTGFRWLEPSWKKLMSSTWVTYESEAGWQLVGWFGPCHWN